MKRALALLILLLAALPAAAQEVRQLNRIATPGAAGVALPPGARAVAWMAPVAPDRVRAALDSVLAAWNTPRLGQLLAPGYYDATRLTDALSTKVPRDAVLRVLAIEGMQTTGQYLQAGADGREQRVSRVAVTVRTQLEYNDPVKGFQRLDGTNEFILLIAEAAS